MLLLFIIKLGFIAEMENKYLDSISFSNDTFNFYIGKNAGEELAKDIKKASKSVTIFSPFVSSNKVDDLIELAKNNVQVHLIFSEDGQPLSNKESNNRYILKKLIRRYQQPEKLDEEEYNYPKRKLVKINKYSKRKDKHKDKKELFINTKSVAVFIIISSIFCFLLYKASYPLMSLTTLAVFFLGIGIGCFPRIKGFLVNIIKTVKNLLNISGYNKSKVAYSYKQRYDNLKFSYILKKNSSEEDTFMHCKYYIIDDTVYIGSLNFTNNGFSNNIETVIKVNDTKLAEDIRAYTNGLFTKGTKINYHNHYKDCPFTGRKSLGAIVYGICD